MTTTDTDTLTEKIEAVLPESMSISKIMADGYPSTFLLDRDDVIERIATADIRRALEG